MCRQPLSTTTNVSLWPLRGTCDKFSGVCTCYADATQGYWDGATCSECLSGYIGSSCRLQSIALSQFSPVHYSGDMIVFSKSIDASTTTTTTTTATTTTVVTSTTSSSTTTASPPSSPSSSSPSATTITQSTAAQPRHWFPHAVTHLSFTILTGSAVAIFDQTMPDAAPITLDLAETFVGGCTTKLFAGWLSPRNGRLFLAVAPSMCTKNEILVVSTLDPNSLRFNIGVQRPNTLRNSLLRYEGWISVDQSYEEVASTDHACWVDAWLQFCTVLYRWNGDYRNAATDSPWNLRCIPVPHRTGSSQLGVSTNPMLTPPWKFFATNAADRIVADVWLDPSLQDLRGMIYWTALDSLFVFGSKMTTDQQISSTRGSFSSSYRTETDNFYHTIHGANSSACFLSIVWRNLSVSTIDLPGPDYLRRSCIVIEKVVLMNDAILIVNAVFETFSGVMVLVMDSKVNPLPYFFDFAESSVPTDYIATATAYGTRGVAVVSHCNRNSFQLYQSAVTADNSGSSTASQTTTTMTATTTSTTTNTATITSTTTNSPTTTISSSPSPSSIITKSTTNTSIAIPAAACLITRFNFNTRDKLQLVVTQVATDSDLPITSLAFAFDQNSILATVSRSPSGLLVRRYLGWAILKAYPALAEVQGGTPVTIFGSGFTSATSTTTSSSSGNPFLCAFQPQGTSLSPTFVYNYNQLAKATTTALTNTSSSSSGGIITSGDTVFVPATYLSDRAVLCPAAAVTRTSATCSNVDTVDVTIFGTLFTGVGTPVFRFSQPTITSTSPSSVYANGNSTLPVTVLGDGFSASEVIKCKFYSNISGEIITDGSFLSASAILCQSPPRVIPLSPDSTIDIANDGFHFTQRPISFRMFGRPSGLQFITSSVTATDKNNYDLPSLTVISIDAAGNPTSEGLGILPLLIKSLGRICTLLNPCSDKDALLVANGTISVPETKLGGNTGAAMIAGSATFTNLELTSKTATGYNGTTPNYLMLIAYISANGWFATTKLYVATGAPVALVIIRAPASVVSDQGDMAATPAVSAIDSGNNIVVSGMESYECQADVLQDPIPDGIQLINVELQVNRPRYAIFSNGLAEFLQIPVYARHGLSYRVRFSIRGDFPIQPVTSGPIHSYCPPGYYKLPGLYQCQSCIAQAYCDGDNISVNPGYWRSSVLSTTVAECPTPAACPGGPVPAMCAPNYKGPRCDLCDAEFGRGITGECDTCPSPAVSGAFMLAIVIGLTTVLTCSIAYTVQNSDRPMPRVVVLQQLVTHVQTLAILASLDNPWPQYFMKTAQWIDAVVDFRIMDTSFGECLISNYNLDFTAKFFFQLVLLGEIFLCIATTKGVLFIRPQFLKSDGLTGNDLLSKGMRRVPLKITTLRIIVPSILCGLFFLHQGTLMYAFGVLDCIDIDLGNGQSESVLLVDPSISCSSSAYKSIAFIAYPIIVILGLLVPIGLVLAYELHRFFRLEERNLRYQLGAFLLSGVTNSSWYWPVVLFIRRGVMVLIVTLLKWPFDAFFLQAVFILYLILLKYIRPYFDKHFLLIDQFGCVINILVINIATMYHTTRNEQWHNAIAPIVICLEIIATIAFSLLISNRWRKWVFVALRIEKKELPVETADNYLQLHEIMRDQDIAEGIVDREAGSYFNIDAFVSGRGGGGAGGGGGGGVGGLLQEMMPVQKIEGGGIDDRANNKKKPRFQGDDEDDDQDNDEEERLRSIYDLPDKRSASANALRRRMIERNRMMNNNNKNNNRSYDDAYDYDEYNSNNNNNFPSNDPKLFSSKQSLSAHNHNPLLTSRGIVENIAMSQLEQTQKQNDKSGHQLMKQDTSNNNKNKTSKISPPRRKQEQEKKTVQEYVPQGVPLPDAKDVTEYQKQIHQAKKDQYRQAEKKRREQEEAQKKERMALSNGPKVVRTSQSLPERSQAFGFEHYRQELAEQAQHRAQSDEDDDNDEDSYYYYSDSNNNNNNNPTTSSRRGSPSSRRARQTQQEQDQDSDEELLQRNIYGDDNKNNKNSIQRSKKAMTSSPPKKRSGTPSRQWKGRFDEIDTSHI